MTIITREQQKQILIDTANHVISRDNTSPYSENLRELARIALASLDAKPVAYMSRQNAKLREKFGTCDEWDVHHQSVGADLPPIEIPESDDLEIMPLYTAPPVQETGVYKDMLNIIGLLENNEWAEHCTSTVLGSLLESEITRLVGKEQLMSVVPDDWQLAPKNPTGPMLAAGYQAYMKGQHRGRFYRSYQAMLEAAPKLSEVDHDDDK